jgi:hypothetical protein
LLQQIINILYRYPKAKLARINNLGGYSEYKKMIRGQKAMELASFDLPPVKSYPDGLPIYFLTGEKFLYQTLFCIQSLSKHTTEKFKFILVDDGSLSERLLGIISKQLPGAEIITKSIIEKNLEKRLPENNFPVLRNKRREYPHIKKLTDIHTLDTIGWKLVLDSDMLFLDEPKAMISWLKNPDRPLHMIDCTESYGYSHLLMKDLCGINVAEKVNVGAIGLNNETINWNDIENWVKTLEQKEGRSYYLEQALSAMLVAGNKCTILPGNEYIVNPSDPMISNGIGILHHYVDLSKKGYYNEAWRKVV